MRVSFGLAVLSIAAAALAQPRADPKLQPEKGPAKIPASEQRLLRVGYSQCNRGEPWREQMDKDIKAQAGRHANIRLFAKDAQNDATRQQAQVREFIGARMDAIIISPKDTSLTAAVAEAHDAGIPVIVLDRAVEGDKYTCFIGADNRLIGREVGAWVKQALHGEGSVVELRGLGSSIPSRDRSEPFREQIKESSITIVYDADMEWLGDKAREKMQAALARNPEKGSIDLVYGANDPAAIAAYYAAKDAGREEEMLFVGVDALPHEGVEAVKAGILDATFEYPNGADRAIDAILKIAAGETVPKTVVLGTRLYTKDTIDQGGVEIPAPK